MIKYGGRERTPKEAASFIAAGIIQDIRRRYGRDDLAYHLDDEGEIATPEEIKALDLQLEKIAEELTCKYTDEAASPPPRASYWTEEQCERWIKNNKVTLPRYLSKHGGFLLDTVFQESSRHYVWENSQI